MRINNSCDIIRYIFGHIWCGIVAPLTIVVAQVSQDILAELIAAGISETSDVALCPDGVVPIGQLSALLQRQERRPDVVILVGLDGELEAYSNELLASYPSIVVVRIVIGSEVVHMEFRQIDLHTLITTACGLFRRHGISPEQRLANYKVVSDCSTASPGQVCLVEVQRGCTVLDRALVWIDALLRLHLKHTAGPGNDLPGLTLSRATIERLLLDAPEKSDAELGAARQSVESASKNLLRAIEESEPRVDPLGDLCKSFELTSPEIEAFLICLAPELDTKYQRVFGFMNDDLSRRNPTLWIDRIAPRSPSFSAYGTGEIQPLPLAVDYGAGQGTALHRRPIAGGSSISRVDWAP